jgi:hypothetical protein
MAVPFLAEKRMVVLENLLSATKKSDLQESILELIKDNRITLKTEDVLLMMDPEDSFIEYYQTMVDKLKEVIQAKRDVQDMSDEQITEILNAMENPESRVLH